MPNLSQLDKQLDQVKLQLFTKKGANYLGRLLCGINFEWDESILTAGINEESLFWNPTFFASMTQETNVTILAHELWHLAYQHGAQRVLLNLDPERANIAADHVINLGLKENGYDMTGFPYLMDPKYTGMSTLEIYKLLPPDAKLPPGGLGMDVKDIVSQEAQTKAIAIAQSAKMVAEMAGDAGTIPGEIAMYIDKFLNPVLDWKIILNRFFNEMDDVGRSFRRPKRRYSDPVLPGKSQEESIDHIMFFQDVSGSVRDQDIQLVNSELKHIWDTYNPKVMTVVTFDTEIHDIYVFNEGDGFNKIKITGRGGTDLSHVYKMIEDTKPTVAVIFTDLYVAIPKRAPKCPLIWICTGNATATVPYGKLIHTK